MMDYDKYGHCVQCHKNMWIEQVIGQQVTKRLSAEYCETEYLLNDGSKMRVAICQTCKGALTPKDDSKIMKCVYRGWEEEIKDLKWSDEKKKTHLQKYDKLKIIGNCEGYKDYKVKNMFKEYLEKEGKDGTHN